MTTERAIQYVYQRYGQLSAAMCANVITYRGRSAAREVGKSLSFDADAQIAWIKSHRDRFACIRGKNRGEVTQTQKVNSAGANLALLRLVHQQQIETFQRVRHAWQETAFLSALDRRKLVLGSGLEDRYEAGTT